MWQLYSKFHLARLSRSVFSKALLRVIKAFFSVAQLTAGQLLTAGTKLFRFILTLNRALENTLLLNLYAEILDRAYTWIEYLIINILSLQQIYLTFQLARLRKSVFSKALLSVFKAIFKVAQATAGQMLTAGNSCFRFNNKYSIHVVALFKIRLSISVKTYQ